MPSLIFFRMPRPSQIGFPHLRPNTAAGVPVPLPMLYTLPFPEKSEVLIGRLGDACDIFLDDARSRVSRRHAILSATGDRCHIQDISTNGTLLNGVALPKAVPAPLGHGDVLNLCEYQFRFVDDRRGCGPTPGMPQRFLPEWRTEHTVGLAAKMRDEREYAALPILADALEEAGCDNDDILAHCREWGNHDIDCWVVGHVLGIEPLPRDTDEWQTLL